MAGAWIKWPVSGDALALNARTVLVGDDGVYSFDGIPLNALQWDFNAQAPGYDDHDVEYLIVPEDARRLEQDFRIRRREQRPRDPAESSAGTAAADATVRLPRRDLAGRAVDPAGKAVARAEVKWGATMYEATQRETVTNDAGEFELDDVPDVEGFVTVIADEFAPQFEKVLLGQIDVVVQLSPGVSTGGRVVGSSGQPLADVTVVPVIPSPDRRLMNPYWLTSRQTRTDAEGRFELQHLPDGARFDFLRADLSELRNQVLDPASNDNVVRIASGGGIFGRVEGPDGEPIRDFRVLVDIPWDYQPTDPVGGFSASYGSSGISYTRDDGRFVLSDMNAANIYRITVVSPGYGHAVLDRVRAHPLDQPPDEEEMPCID